MNGGQLIAEVLKAQGVPFLFTLVGGHISPILVAAKRAGIRVIDTRHEATAVFAADATARLTGRPGVAAVTAGPGVTNTLTAVKNAQMAQSPVIVIGGAAPTALQGRGALQDIDQMSLFTSVVKWSKAVRRVKDLVPALEEAFSQAQSDVPGPVFVECPVDLLYDESMVRKLYDTGRGGKSLGQKAVNAYLTLHVNRMFAGAEKQHAGPMLQIEPLTPDADKVRAVAERLQRAQRPVLIVGSQATLDAAHVADVAAALERIGAPVYLSGMARGLLGRDHPLQLRHKRREALKEADLVLLAGVQADFRLDYGNHIRRSAFYVSANRSAEDLNKNRKPDIGVLGDPRLFLRQLAGQIEQADRWPAWIGQLRSRDATRNDEIARQALDPVTDERAGASSAPTSIACVNPLHLLRELDREIGPQTILVADGGDFVATASYTVQPPGPLTWLDPGPFGTLGVGAGFALGAKLCRPEAEVWILYGDGSAGYSLAEFDTFVRHGVAVIALVGNDASWSQIAREQVEMLGDDVATVLKHTDYHRVAEGFGGIGFKLDDPELAGDVLQQARQAAAAGKPVLVNAILGRTDFRKGSISM